MNDAGIEVIYLGLSQTVESVVSAAAQEDVDIIGISVLDGGHTLIAKDLMEALYANNSDNIKVIFGGIIPEQDRPILQDIGIREIFGPGTPIGKIIDVVQRVIQSNNDFCFLMYRLRMLKKSIPQSRQTNLLSTTL